MTTLGKCFSEELIGEREEEKKINECEEVEEGSVRVGMLLYLYSNNNTYHCSGRFLSYCHLFSITIIINK